MPDQQPAPGPRELAEFGVFRAARAHWVIVILTLLVFVVAAVAIALVRTPVYTSTVSLNVSYTADSVATQPGAVDAAQNLAESYARSIYASKVIGTVAKDTDLDRDEVRGRVRATPVADATVLFIQGSGSSAQEALEVTQASAHGLVDYVQGLGSSKLEKTKLFDRFKRASRRFQELVKQRDKANRGSGDASVDLESEVSQAQLQQETYAQLYRGSQRGVVAPLEILSGSRTATSDFKPRLQLLLIAGVIGGLLAGVALASLKASRQRRREQKS